MTNDSIRQDNFSSIRILCAIANHGIKNQHYLEQLLAAYQKMPVKVTIVVLSDIPKDLGSGVEVRVGLPSKNPWSLPFAHRQLFLERLEDFDYFIYSEDDTLLTWEVMQAFMHADGILDENEIPGFLRTEVALDGTLYYSSCHSFFRWIPSSLRERGGQLWARYSNEHAACFIVSQTQLSNAIASKSFPLEPHEGRHDMLCAAATDIYTQCGIERLVCLDNIQQFTLPHLPNKYIGEMGLPAEELNWQINALRGIYADDLPNSELLNPETRLPLGIGSKFYREQPDLYINALINDDKRTILVWGAGDGIFESNLKEQGHKVSVIPLDAVVGESCRKRGLNVLYCKNYNFNQIDEKFDYVILRDVLHLVNNPEQLLLEIRQLLLPGGQVLIRIPNFYDIRMLKHRWLNHRFKRTWDYEYVGAVQFTPNTLKQIAKRAGFNNLSLQTNIPDGARQLINSVSIGLLAKFMSPHLYLCAKSK